ncbi:MAG: hypothetical protein SGPRY_006807 [Prymnesium sp.]
MAEDWSRTAPAIMRGNEWATHPSACLVSTSRRFGKTISIDMFVASLAICKCDIGILSPDKWQSATTFDRVVQFLGYLGASTSTQGGVNIKVAVEVTRSCRAGRLPDCS